mmetsp:Transcript_30248/g.60638  ORF Transcript_30248/g.60638 Transcript_30248/m.60638 type:complete len:1211 (+) Transcript_30248:165-3797(+)
MNLFSSYDFRESKENDPRQSRGSSNAKNDVMAKNILGTSRRHPQINTYRNIDYRKTSNFPRDFSGAMLTKNEQGYDEDALSPTTLNENLAKQGWQNHGNGVYSNESEKMPTTARSSASRRNGTSVSGVHSSNSTNNHHIQQSRPESMRPQLCELPMNSHNRSNSPVAKSNSSMQRSIQISSQIQSSPGGRSNRAPFSMVTKSRFMMLTSAIGLALLGIFWDASEVMNSVSFTSTLASREWLLNLPSSFSHVTPPVASVIVETSTAEESLQSMANGQLESIQDEWKRIQELTISRAERRRMRTKPPSLSAAPSSGMTADGTTKPESIAPRLYVDLPAHKVLDNALVEQVIASSSNGVRRRLKEADASNPCGAQATEASLLYPKNYPTSANLNSNSRVVVTGALSQLGMELILQLHEHCGVKYIMGIDSAYPNTRYDRMDMIEWRYNYIQRRVPGFQKLLVPVFGIHPHPKMGEEIRFENMNKSFDLVERFQPTHIVNLAGMEEGRGEHVDYGDTEDASPFVVGGASSMMRRFEALVSMDQILSSLAKQNKSGRGVQPQLVHLSSNEAHDRSGVATVKDSLSGTNPAPATVHGTVCLINEALASYFNRHHRVDAVILRVPTIYGPHARPGSLVYDLAERTVRRSVGEVSGVPKYHLDKDRFDLPNMWTRREGALVGAVEQIAFAADVAQGILAAMQFKKDHSLLEAEHARGPTMIRLGSKFTTSMRDLKEKMESYLPPLDQWEPEATTSTTTEASKIYNSASISIYDTERDRDLLGWTHTTGLHEGTKAMLAWHALKAYPYGIPSTLKSQSTLENLIADSQDFTRSLHHLPCASGCRWHSMCSSSNWDEVVDVSRSMTTSCQYIIYTVDLHPELFQFEKESTPSQRNGWEDQFCKIAFVSSSSKMALSLYGDSLQNGSLHEWNGKRKSGYWNVIAVNGSHYTMSEAERSLAKLSPNLLFNRNVAKAMYVNHRKVILTTDQAMGVMRHLDMSARENTEKKIVTNDEHQEMRIYLPPRAQRHSLFFTNKYYFADDFDTSNAKNLANFVMGNVGITETKDIRAQVAFYEQSGHLTRTNVQRSANYQEVFQDNDFPFEFLRSTWLVHELRSEMGRNLRCEMYEEHSSWGNSGMEDLSMGFVLAKRKVKLQLGRIAAPEYEGPEEWYPLLEPRRRDDNDAITEGPVYLNHLESEQKIATDDDGSEFFISFLPQKRLV